MYKSGDHGHFVLRNTILSFSQLLVVFHAFVPSFVGCMALYLDLTSTGALSYLLRELDEPSLSTNESSALAQRQTPGTDVLSAPPCANAT
jgi:hypothetical protein